MTRMKACTVNDNREGIGIGATVWRQYITGAFEGALLKELEHNLGVGILILDGEDDVDGLPRFEGVGDASDERFFRVKAGASFNAGDMCASSGWLLGSIRVAYDGHQRADNGDHHDQQDAQQYVK